VLIIIIIIIIWGWRVSVSPNIYVPLYRGISVLQLCRWKFSQKETVADFIQLKLTLFQRKESSLFEPPLGIET